MYTKTRIAFVAAAVAVMTACVTVPAEAGHSTGTWRFLPNGLNAGAYYGGASPYGGPYGAASPDGGYAEHDWRGFGHRRHHGWSHDWDGERAYRRHMWD